MFCSALQNNETAFYTQKIGWLKETTETLGSVLLVRFYNMRITV